MDEKNKGTKVLLSFNSRQRVTSGSQPCAIMRTMCATRAMRNPRLMCNPKAMRNQVMQLLLGAVASHAFEPCWCAAMMDIKSCAH